MMKLSVNYKWFIAAILITVSGLLSSCGDSSDSLSGVYAYYDGDGFGMVYEFKSDSQVIYYSVAHNGKDTVYGTRYYKQIGNTNWYLSDLENGRSYTYVYENGTLVIPMQGTIFQVSGTSLHEDGTSRTYFKQ